MRAALLVTALGALLSAAPLPPRPVRPLLLVARAACRAPDPAVLSQTRLDRYAAEMARFSVLVDTYRLLDYKDTCDTNWEAAVTRHALATLAAGGGVVSSGRLGAAVCGALAAATAALRRPAPAACYEGRVRGAAVAELARRLAWRRALVARGGGPECSAALRDVERTLSAAGVLVRRPPRDDGALDHPHGACIARYQMEIAMPTRCCLLRDDIAILREMAERQPNVVNVIRHCALEIFFSGAGLIVRNERFISRGLSFVILCESSIDSALLPDAVTGTELLLLRIAEPMNLRKLHKMDDIKENSVLAPEAALHTFISDSQKSFWDTFSSSYRVNQISTEQSLPVNNETVLYKSTSRRSKLKPKNFTKSRTRSQERTEHRRRARGAHRSFDYGSSLVAGFNETLSGRTLLLDDEFSEADPTAQSLYNDILAATLLHLEASRSGIEFFENNFILYKSTFVDGTGTWMRMASLSAASQRPLGQPDTAATAVAIDASGELQLQRWSASRAADAQRPPDGRTISAHATVVLLCIACAACGVAAVGAACVRRAAARRAPRRPRAAPVLASADFQFPADERRRVGEGMETMLSWLQQLHEFADPEPERPDLLKRPEPLGQSAPSSTCSVTRLAADNRTRYKGDPVHMKYLPAATLELRRKTVDILLVMQSLRHENLNPFIGCLTEVRPALVFEACGRGSLEDVLVADDIALDWTFRLSLLTDVVRGMRYLHASPVRVHARLSSRNCVVDSRWVLRITDYGLPALATAQALPYPPRAARELLWTAPELLREGSAAAVPGGTQAGDVYSFAIIMQEVIVRGEPYCMLPLTPEELVLKLQHPPPLVRPSVSLGAAPPDAVGVMRQCWSEQPDLRPDFARLYELFRHMHRGRKTNIVDSMFEMLEKYSNNLEELIKDRTEQLDMEKKKTEQLLNRMLPRSVAERLMLGLRVEPEEFEEVSIYFSDIVGFTAIAARSSPVQVVDLLNDLYTTFDAAIEQYRVYKVETIGDAYMVVGGLPVRRADHAESVATMALHLLHLAGRFRIRHLPGAPLHLRIGLHTGACCAGVVGLTMPRYCLFGDTVNTAARMESTGAAWRVQVSDATATRLSAAGGFRLRARGLTQVKGKGAMHTYWLLGKDGFDKPLPSPPPLESEEVLFEADGENEPSPPPAPRHRADASPAADKFAWQRSGAVSAESSPPAPSLPRCRYLRSSVSTVAGLLDTPRLSDRWSGRGARVLRRQWSLERGDVLAAAAAEGPAAPRDSWVPLEPLALRPQIRAPPPRYRTRRDASLLDVSDR